MAEVIIKEISNEDDSSILLHPINKSESLNHKESKSKRLILSILEPIENLNTVLV